MNYTRAVHQLMTFTESLSQEKNSLSISAGRLLSHTGISNKFDESFIH